MTSELADIQRHANKYVKLTADIGGGEVELVDINGYRVAGTGEFRIGIAEKLPAMPRAYTAAIDNREQIVVRDAKRDPLIQKCNVFRNRKDLRSLIASPVISNGEVLGVMGTLIDDDVKPNLITNFRLYTFITKQTAEFIAMRYQEKDDTENLLSMINSFEIVIRNMEEGAIVVNNDDQIEIINQSAKSQLGIKRIIEKEAIKITPTGDTVSGSEEFKIKIGPVETTVIGQVFKAPENKYYQSVILFKNLQKLQSNIYDMTSTVNIADTDNIIGSSQETEQLKKNIKKVAPSISTVLITGESGTGKEIVATAIWKNSDRKDRRFVAINCAAIPESLLESELFGYVKGAFTGADPKGRMGKFELANGGVIFLDEIGDMPIYLQSKLLRVIQEKKMTRIGSNQIIPLDVRIIAATNKNLQQMIKENLFREDLYYRLNVIPIDIPPLRERPEDIKDLLYYYIEYYRKLFGKKFQKISDDALEMLLNYPWPGNVRELENAVEYMVNMMGNGKITKETLPKVIFDPYHISLPRDEIRPLKVIEQEEILKAIRYFGDNTKGKEQAAHALGIGIATLYRKLQQIDEKSKAHDENEETLKI
ncbi:MAG: sigma 54-interacting transcriptional regulator [Tissierellia bacterium]|nr:sigma 54-interacting transcriptional regulator [Tissierellia bacterium]